ncbi:MAG: Mut7-C RNAse domain-containing protein [Sulfolobales archaeon]|nr:Mut7-C RNAse domain-containing protein [Sulfolobales archaeon]MCX8208855.1 Mut7-C RNAse domain-containing protein [Sulfolobales archaeon]MDW8010518.1 Mut7-C RNAse domain-containing protein [Sulfolobales archaeon]
MVKIVVDSMLGNLARWLRVLGYDTEYSRKMRDSDILEIAIREGRVIITRDRGLHRKAVKKNLKSVYVSPDLTDVVDMLTLVAKTLGLSIRFDKGSTRCPLCNTKLDIVPKARVASLVPPEVLNKYDTFWYCVKCRKAYWQGNHWKTINDTIDIVRSRLNANPPQESFN